MAINKAQKYSPKVVKRFRLKSLTEVGVNQNYDWAGVATVSVWTLPTVALSDYTRSGSDRYGTPTELQDTVQDMLLTKDRSWSITVDQGNNSEQMMVKKAGEILAMQTDEVAKPEIDIYRLAAMSAAAITNGAYAIAATTGGASGNAFEKFLDGQAVLDEAKVNIEGRVAFVTPSFFNKIKRDSSFTLASEMNAKRLVNGMVGDIDGVKIIKVPSSYLPTNTEFIIAHPSVTVAPIKLKEYKTHVNPPGINGLLSEGRFIYDAFVLDTKVDGLFTHFSSSPTA